jgi:hypothetical protein
MLTDTQNREFGACINLLNTYCRPTDESDHEMYDMFLILVIEKLLILKEDIMKYGTPEQQRKMKNLNIVKSYIKLYNLYKGYFLKFIFVLAQPFLKIVLFCKRSANQFTLSIICFPNNNIFTFK